MRIFLSFAIVSFALLATAAWAQSLEETLAVLYGNPPRTLKRLNDSTIENGSGVKFIAVDRSNCVVQEKGGLGVSEFHFNNVIVDEIRKYWTDFGSGPALNYALLGNPRDRVACRGGAEICDDRTEFSAVGDERVKNLQDAMARLYPGLCHGTRRLDPEAKKQVEEREERREKGQREMADANKRAVESPEGKRAFAALEIEQDTNAKLLRDAYAAYVLLRRCDEARQGYLGIYVSRAELGRARKAVKRIEQNLKPKIKLGLNIDEIWDVSNHHADQWPIARHSCQYAYESLMQQDRTVAPEEHRMRKDF